VRNRLWVIAAAAICVAALLPAYPSAHKPPASAPPQKGAQAQAPQVQQRTADARELFDFQNRVKAYVALHKKLEDGLPNIGANADATAVRTHQKALAAALQSARATAKVGDVFTPETRRALRRAIARGLGPAERSSLMNPESNPGGFKPRVNAEYPASLPVTTMPPTVLLNMPPLPDEIEFRFVGRYLILRDTHADIIVDFMTAAFS
jgi:hypothetical protein